MNKNKIAIIAGSGTLPKLIIENCENSKKEYLLILVKNNTNVQDYKKYNYDIIEIGNIGQAIDLMKSNNVKEITFAGGIKKPSFFNLRVDIKGGILLSKILKSKILGDDNILTIVINFFQKEGFKIIGVDQIIKNIVSDKGTLSKVTIADEFLPDIELGKNILKKTSEFDLGQSIIVQQKQILGLEGLEGTDNLIRRCSDLAFLNGRRPILVKMKKINQNDKIDLPTIGINTLQEINNANYAGIAFEANYTLILDREKIVEFSNKNNLFLIAI